MTLSDAAAAAMSPGLPADVDPRRTATVVEYADGQACLDRSPPPPIPMWLYQCFSDSGFGNDEFEVESISVRIVVRAR
jgi:hypothetical protein